MLNNPNWTCPFDERRLVSDHLLRAADYIEEHGWCQGSFEEEGRVCIQGALARTELTTYGDTFKAMLRITSLTKRIPYHWNDDIGRTKEEVVSMLRKAASV